jgi:hypothetical protein
MEENVRVLDFIYEPAEAAPGDTVKCRAVFTGNEVDVETAALYISHNVVSNAYGFDTAYDIHVLDTDIRKGFFSDNTTCIEFSLIVPPDIMYTSAMIPDDWLSVIPNSGELALPDTIRSITKDEMLEALDTIASNPARWIQSFQANPGPEDMLLYSSLPFLLQIFTVKMRLFVKVEGHPTIQSDYTVRYHSRFEKYIPGVYVNSNPSIDSIGIFIVNEPNRTTYDPSENNHTYIRLFTRDDEGDGGSGSPDTTPVLLLDTGYTYFIAAFTGQIDSTLTIDAARQGGGPALEKHRKQWFIRCEGENIDKVSGYDYMSIGGLSTTIESMQPPLDKNVRSATIWVQVFDTILNELFRPVGSTLAEARVSFRYTRAYLDNAELIKKTRME